MNYNVRETETAFVLQLDTPGCAPTDIKVQADAEQLTVATARGMKSFWLPRGCATDDITAEYEYGVLRLNVPKRNRKLIPVTALSPPLQLGTQTTPP